jgi:hypothetical protein
MHKDDLTGNGASENKTEEKKFTKAGKGKEVEFIQIDVDKFDFDGYEVVRREWFSKANCPAVTFRDGSVTFNIRAIRKLDECSHIHILMNSGKKLIMVKPCMEDDKDALQWSRIDKQKKTVPRMIKGKDFTERLYTDMGWEPESIVKVLGTLLKCKDEKVFVFKLTETEAYSGLAEPCEDNPKRHKRVALPQPEHWQGHYGQSYEESQESIVTTFEEMPEGFIKMDFKKSANDKIDDVIKPTEQDNSNKKVKGGAEKWSSTEIFPIQN